MSKSKLSSRLVVSRIALFTVIGSSLLIFMAAGTSAAPFSFMDSVKEFLGLRGTSANAATSVSATSPGAAPLNAYGLSWLKVTESTGDTPKRPVKSRPNNEPFYKQAAPVPAVALVSAIVKAPPELPSVPVPVPKFLNQSKVPIKSAAKRSYASVLKTCKIKRRRKRNRWGQGRR